MAAEGDKVKLRNARRWEAQASTDTPVIPNPRRPRFRRVYNLRLDCLDSAVLVLASYESPVTS
jgi:hypothetical protein